MTDVKVKIRDKVRTRKKILDAVGEVIRKHGITRLTTHAVASAAGVHRVLVYRYFGSRHKLLDEYLGSRSAELSSSNQPGTGVHSLGDVSPPDELTAAALDMFSHVWQSKSVQRELVAEMTAGNTPAQDLLDWKLKQMLYHQDLADSERARAMIALVYSSVCYLGICLACGQRVAGMDIHSQDSFDRLSAVVAHIVRIAEKVSE